MTHDGSYQDGLTGGRAADRAGWAAGGQRPPAAPRPGGGGSERQGLGGLWLLLAPVACCGGPFLIAALAGALAWAGLGLAAVALAAVTAVVLIRRRRRSRACCEPGAAGWPEKAGTAPARRPAAR